MSLQQTSTPSFNAAPPAQQAPPPLSLGLPDLAFVGEAGSGKTTAANFLASFFGYQTYSFAQPIKRICASIWGEFSADDRDKKQRIGEAVRAIDEAAWVNMLLNQMDRPWAGRAVSITPRRPRVVDDVRYPNEAYALKGAGFVLVRVTAPEGTRLNRLTASGRLQAPEQLQHVSETAGKDIDAEYLLVNDGETRLAEFENDIVHVVTRERKRR